MITSSPLSLLPLPAFDGLTEAQVRGQCCVFDGAPLSGPTTVDLGERTYRSVGEHATWRPRACRWCAEQRALDALVEHSHACQQCKQDHTKCPTGLGLVRAVREASR